MAVSAGLSRTLSAIEKPLSYSTPFVIYPARCTRRTSQFSPLTRNPLQTRLSPSMPDRSSTSLNVTKNAHASRDISDIKRVPDPLSPPHPVVRALHMLALRQFHGHSPLPSTITSTCGRPFTCSNDSSVRYSRMSSPTLSCSTRRTAKPARRRRNSRRSDGGRSRRARASRKARPASSRSRSSPCPGG